MQALRDKARRTNCNKINIQHFIFHRLFIAGYAVSEMYEFSMLTSLSSKRVRRKRVSLQWIHGADLPPLRPYWNSLDSQRFSSARIDPRRRSRIQCPESAPRM